MTHASLRRLRSYVLRNQDAPYSGSASRSARRLRVSRPRSAAHRCGRCGTGARRGRRTQQALAAYGGATGDRRCLGRSPSCRRHCATCSHLRGGRLRQEASTALVRARRRECARARRALLWPAGDRADTRGHSRRARRALCASPAFPPRACRRSGDPSPKWRAPSHRTHTHRASLNITSPILMLAPGDR